MSDSKLEIACFNLESAITAQHAGADRIELCANRNVGGTTPDLATIKLARKEISIDLHIMIRQRGGDFVYSDLEFEEMKKDVLECKKAGVNGVVFGILNRDFSIDGKRNYELVELAKPMFSTFHRAFDTTPDPLVALANCVACGFDTILTSGQKQNAMDGVELLNQLIKNSNNRIQIMPGGGIRSTNISALLEKIKVAYYHSSAIIDESDFADTEEIKLIREKLSQ